MDKLKIVRAKAAAIGSLGVLLEHDRASLMQILTFVKEHLLAEEAQAARAMLLADEAVRKARYGKA